MKVNKSACNIDRMRLECELDKLAVTVKSAQDSQNISVRQLHLETQKSCYAKSGYICGKKLFGDKTGKISVFSVLVEVFY